MDGPLSTAGIVYGGYPKMYKRLNSYCEGALEYKAFVFTVYRIVCK